MADKVIRLSGLFGIGAQACTGSGKVTLQVTGRADGREVRVELELESYDIEHAVNGLRAAVKVHKERWDQVHSDLGAP